MKILGVSKVAYPQSPDQLGPTLSFVLVAGEIGDYACYAGYGSTDWVALHGDKVSFEMACSHFPGGQLVRERYRL